MYHFLPNEIWIEILKYDCKDVFNMGRLNKKWHLWFKTIYIQVGRSFILTKYNKIPHIYYVERIFKLHYLFGEFYKEKLIRHYSVVNAQIEHGDKYIYNNLRQIIENIFGDELLNNNHTFVSRVLNCNMISRDKIKRAIKKSHIEDLVRFTRKELLELLLINGVVDNHQLCIVKSLPRTYSTLFYQLLQLLNNYKIKFKIEMDWGVFYLYMYVIENNCWGVIDHFWLNGYNVILDKHQMNRLLTKITLEDSISLFNYYDQSGIRFNINKHLCQLYKHGHSESSFDIFINNAKRYNLDINYNDGEILYHAVMTHNTALTKVLLKNGADPQSRGGVIYHEVIENMPNYIEEQILAKSYKKNR